MSHSVRARSVTKRVAIVSALAAGLFLAYVIALPPHLVHHLFDQDDHGRPTCPYFAQSQQTPELQADPPALTPLIATGILYVQLPEFSHPSLDLTVSYPRAPPRPSPST